MPLTPVSEAQSVPLVYPLCAGAESKPPYGARAAGAAPSSAEVAGGADAYVRIRLESPAVLSRGDRFILRAYSPPVTIAGQPDASAIEACLSGIRCLLYTSPSPRDRQKSRMPSSA